MSETSAWCMTLSSRLEPRLIVTGSGLSFLPMLTFMKKEEHRDNMFKTYYGKPFVFQINFGYFAFKIDKKNIFTDSVEEAT